MSNHETYAAMREVFCSLVELNLGRAAAGMFFDLCEDLFDLEWGVDESELTETQKQKYHENKCKLRSFLRALYQIADEGRNEEVDCIKPHVYILTGMKHLKKHGYALPDIFPVEAQRFKSEREIDLYCRICDMITAE